RLRKDAAGVGRWQQRKGRKQEFNQLLLQARVRLQQLYARPLQPVEMRRQKAAAFATLQNDYHSLKQKWGEYSGYDHWFGRELNNARLASVATYAQWVSAFLALLEESDGELARFYLASEQLAKTPPQQRRSRLHKLRQQ
ncbi:MAG: aminopeptidase, partial [Deltaproteobacteria bacterium]|nr:aminopeptidase [Deltaproteobacteria bacterium]